MPAPNRLDMIGHMLIGWTEKQRKSERRESFVPSAETNHFSGTCPGHGPQP